MAATADGGELTYIEVTRDNIVLANQLAHTVLGWVLGAKGALAFKVRF